MYLDGFHDTQEKMIHSDEHPMQDQHIIVAFDQVNISNFNPVNGEACQTNLIAKAVEGLAINPEEGTDMDFPNIEATPENNEFGERTGSLTNNFVAAAANNADATISKSGMPLA